jgi:chromate reductase
MSAGGTVDEEVSPMQPGVRAFEYGIGGYLGVAPPAGGETAPQSPTSDAARAMRNAPDRSADCPVVGTAREPTHPAIWNASAPSEVARRVAPVHVLLLSGSLRQRSTNSAVLRTALRLLPDTVAPTLYDGMAQLPAFNPDRDEDPLPPEVADLRAQINAADALLFSTPEYAGALPGSFKNLLDWTVGDAQPGSINKKPVGWVNVATRGAPNAHESLRKVLGYVGADIVKYAGVEIRVTSGMVGIDGLVADEPVRLRLSHALEALAEAARPRTSAEGDRSRAPLDAGTRQVHTFDMHPRRLSIPDARGHGASLRVTKHPEQRKIVLSHWRDGVCTASTPVDLSEVPALIGVLADALGDAIDAPAVENSAAAPRTSLVSIIRSWLRPRLAQITELRLVRDPSKDQRAS